MPNRVGHAPPWTAFRKEFMDDFPIELKREEILRLASAAKLMIADGSICYLNDRATDKELISFARMLEAFFKRTLPQQPVVTDKVPAEERDMPAFTRLAY